MHNTEHMGPLFKVIGNAVDSDISRQVNKTGLTSAQMFILHFLSKQPENEIFQKDLEQALELSHATVAGIISRLEAKGFLKLVPSEKDKRCKQIVATEKAMEVDEKTDAVINAAESQLLTGFSDEEKTQLRSYLNRLLGNLGIEMPSSGYPEGGQRKQ